MGVSGSGKSTVGQLLAQRLGWIFAEGDEDHSRENVEKMRSGVPLDAADREPWLRRLRERISGWLEAERSAVLACSALTSAARETLRVDPDRVRFVHLAGSRETLAERLEQRRGHFMPLGLLDDQLATLEPPEPHEALEVDIEHDPESTVDEICHRLGLE